MKLGSLFSLYLARLRARVVLVQELLAIVGITVGVALLFASQVAATSLSSSVDQVDKQVIGQAAQLQLQARSAAGFSSSVLTATKRLPGVADAFPLIEQQANLVGPRGERSVDLVGLDPRFAHLAGPLFKRFSAKQLEAQRAIALPEPIANSIGAGSLQTATVQIAGHVTNVLVGATLGTGEIGSMVNNPVAIAPIAFVQDLADMPGRVTRVFIHAAPGALARVRVELAHLAVRENLSLAPADFDTKLFSVAVAPDSQSEALFSAISALVGFVFALNAMLITVPSRRSLVEEVRRNGATRLTVGQILLFDALVLAVIACTIGLVLGDLLSIAVFRSTPGYLAFAFPVGNNRIITAKTILLALTAGVLASLIGVFWPMRDFLTRTTSRAHASQVGGPLRLLVGALAISLTTLILIADTDLAVVGEVTLVIALLCLLPSLLNWVTLTIERAQPRIGTAASRLATTELRAARTRVRSLAISATAALAVFGTVEFGGIVHNLTGALDGSARGIDSMAAVWVTAAGQSNAFATTSFDSSHKQALQRLPGVASVGEYRGSFLNWGKRRLWVLAPASNVSRPIPSGQLLTGVEQQIGQRLRSGGWAILSKALAGEQHLKVGQSFLLPAPDPLHLRVAALSTNLGWAPGALILNQADYARAWQSNAPSAYQIQLTPGASPARVKTAVEQALGANSGLVVETAGQREQRHFALAGQGLSRLTQIRLLLIIAALLAVTGSMSAMIWQRRNLVAAIKCEGYTRGVLMRWLLSESAVLFAIGCASGALFGLYGQLLGSHFLANVTGFPITFGIEGVAAITSFALMTGLALAVVALPGYLVVRVPARPIKPAF